MKTVPNGEEERKKIGGDKSFKQPLIPDPVQWSEPQARYVNHKKVNLCDLVELKIIGLFS